LSAAISRRAIQKRGGYQPNAEGPPPTEPPPKPSTALALRDEAVELAACRNALGDIEVLIYEAWECDAALTKDAARRFLAIADICGWDMPWVDEMRAWSL
jgi:hypothetical protein